MELLPALVVLDVGAVHSYDVSDLAHNWTLLKSVCINDDDRVFSVLYFFVAQRVDSAVNYFERADPLAFGTLDGVGSIDDDTIAVHLVYSVCVQRVVFCLSSQIIVSEISTNLIKSKVS